MNWLIFAFGIYLIIDGIASLIYFRREAPFFHQLVRVGRTFIGFSIIIDLLT
jgi:hypothetical protein